MFESLESRRLMAGDHPLGVVLNGTALSTVNGYLTTTENQIKALGIDSVRVYQGIPAGATSIPSGTNGQLDHLFDLYNALGPSSSYASHKFNILLTVTPQENATPDTDTNLQSYLTSLLNYQKSGSTVKLKDIIAGYEIGNEINTPTYYNYSSSDTSSTSTARLDNYIDHFLAPAASTISSLDPTANISAGAILGYNSGTANTLGYLLNNVSSTTAGQLDEVSFHPYGTNATDALTSSFRGECWPSTHRPSRSSILTTALTPATSSESLRPNGAPTTPAPTAAGQAG